MVDGFLLIVSCDSLSPDFSLISALPSVETWRVNFYCACPSGFYSSCVCWADFRRKSLCLVMVRNRRINRQTNLLLIDYEWSLNNCHCGLKQKVVLKKIRYHNNYYEYSLRVFKLYADYNAIFYTVYYC